MSLVQNEGIHTKSKSHVLDDYMKLKENFTKGVDGLYNNPGSNTVTSYPFKAKEYEPSSYSNKELSSNSQNMLEKHNKASLSHGRHTSGGLSIQSQFESNISNKTNEGMLSSSSRGSLQEVINKQASRNSLEQKGSFKKNLINNSVQRFQNVSSSYTSPSSTSNQITGNSRNIQTIQEKNVHNSEPQEVRKNISVNEPISQPTVKEIEVLEPKNVESTQEVIQAPQINNNIIDHDESDSQGSQYAAICIDQPGFEEATMEALKNLSNRLFTSGADEARTDKKIAKGEATGNDKFEKLPCETVGVSDSTSSEVFLNALAMAADKDAKNQLNKNGQLDSIKTCSAKLEVNDTKNKIVEGYSSEEERVEQRVPTPAPHYSKKNSRTASNESFKKSTGQKYSRDIEVDVSGDPYAFNYSGVKTPAKEELYHDNGQEVQGFTGFVSPMSPQADGNQTIQLSNLYVLNNTMHQLLGIKCQEESFEKGITGNLLRNSHIQSSHNVSFSVDQPTADRDCRDREFMPIVSNFMQNPTELLICNSENLRKQEIEPDRFSQYPPQDQNNENKAFESFSINREGDEVNSDKAEEMMTSIKCNLQLIEAIKRINVRTFLMLKNIIKPSENILFCCQAFAKLFAGLSDVIPVSFSIMENVEWGNIKVLFNSPIKILNLVSSLPNLIEESHLPQRNVNAALSSLAKIQYEEEDTQTDAFYQLYEFIVSAIEYYKYFKPEYITSREQSPQKSTERSNVRGSNFSQNQEAKKPGLNCKSKSPYKQTQQSHNLISETTAVSTSRRYTNRSTSPINECLSSQRVLQSNANRNSLQSAAHSRGMKTAPQKRSVISKTPVPAQRKEGQKINPQIQTPIRNLRNAFNDSDQKEFQEMSQEFTQSFIADRINTHEVECEVTRLDDDIERNNKEAREYRAKASRLLIDHERYIKKLQKTKEIIREELERDAELQDRRDMSSYLESKEVLEKHYIREIIMEEFEVQKELKNKEVKVRQEEQNDELLESLKDHCYLNAQKERKKHEKKKLLWEQYKKISAERLAKRQKETEEGLNQKREIANRKVEDYIWKKQQVTQTKNKFKGDYELLSKLIGDAI